MIEIPIIKLKRSDDRLKFMVVDPMPIKQCLISESSEGTKTDSVKTGDFAINSAETDKKWHLSFKGDFATDQWSTIFWTNWQGTKR